MYLGNIIFEDQMNGIKGYLDIGTVKKKTKDYFKGQIIKNGVPMVNNITGNY
jgi:hypothetical protein